MKAIFDTWIKIKSSRKLMLIRHAFFLIILSLLSSCEAQQVNVMTYNIRFATENDGINAWSKRKERVFQLLQKYDPDIIGVQEALHSQLEDIIAALPEYDYVGVGRDDGKRAGEYSAILYKKNKFTVSEQNTFWLSEQPQIPGSKSWDAAITRVATWAKLSDVKSRKAFFVLNTHFDHIGKEARLKSAGLIKNQIRSLAGDLPVIVLGDFNHDRNDSPYQVMTNTNGIALIDPAPENPPGTFCTFAVNSILCTAIDYIYHSHHWKSNNYVVAQDHDGSNYPSDHLPVMVNLTPADN